MDPEDEISAIHLLGTVRPSDSLSVLIHRSVGESGLVGTLIINNVEPKFSNLHKLDFKYKPQVGSLVSTLHGKNWYRGLLYEKHDYDLKVALVDSGIIVRPKALCRLPPSDRSNMGSAVRVTFAKGIPDLFDLIGTKIEVAKVNSLDEKMILCEFKTYGKAYVIPWEAEVEDFPEIVSQFKPGMITKISTFYSTRSVYLQPNDQSQLIKILDSVAAHCETSSHLMKVPFCGQMVACLYKRVYCRGKIFKVENEQYYVRLVDFGTVEKFNLEKMFELPDDIKKIPYQAIKVGLEGLPHSNLNTPASQLFNILIQKSMKIKLDYESLDNVKLFTQSCFINEKIEECMKPFLTRNLKGLNPGRIFNKRDLLYEKWNAGEALKVETLSKSDKVILLAKSGKFFLNAALENADEINAHCNSLEFFMPFHEEVCFGKRSDPNKGGVWSRAICLQVSDHSSELFFVDYGTFESVSHSDIRPMIYRFLTFPVATKECVLFGVNNPLKDILLKELNLKQLDATVVGDFEEKIVVFVPKVNEYLKENNLPEISQPIISNL